MKRRNFLKLIPFAGFAAVCPAILKAVPVPKVLTIWKNPQLRATASPTLHFQMVGRGLRPKHKGEIIILDHIGNIHKFKKESNETKRLF